MKTKQSKQQGPFNINYNVDQDGILTLKVDLNHREKPSNTNKSILVASGGFISPTNPDGSIRKEQFTFTCWAPYPNPVEITKNYITLAKDHQQARLLEAVLRSLNGQHFLLAEQLGVNLTPEETV